MLASEASVTLGACRPRLEVVLIQGEASSTASGAAMMRAAHLVIDGDPKLLVDPYAARFLDEDRRAGLETNPAMRLAHVRGSRANVLSRSAFAEEQLVRVIDRGCRQYVLLGAGYDTSPLRLAGALSECVTFEVDHPATQAAKRAALAGLSWPDNVRFVAVDFERDALSDRLGQAGWRAEAPTFWSWLGVTMYLTDDAVMATLALIADGPPGTTIVFNYTVHPDEVDPGDLALRQAGATGVARQGEPWINFYRPAELAERVAALGFSSVRPILAGELSHRYFDGRDDGLWCSSLTALMVAQV
jgi:methyltransferase (TIGR00027 family)